MTFFGTKKKWISSTKNDSFWHQKWFFRRQIYRVFASNIFFTANILLWQQTFYYCQQKISFKQQKISYLCVVINSISSGRKKNHFGPRTISERIKKSLYFHSLASVTILHEMDVHFAEYGIFWQLTVENSASERDERARHWFCPAHSSSFRT